MGIVFRAHDTKLQRDVALKLLPEHFAEDTDRLLRFQREAQVLASLNHPNIAQIYGLEESPSTRCIVMELVEGETLQQRLKRGPIPVDEALQIAKQVAEALEAAHEKGIIHRDLKPANVKITPDSKVKVLDFGLAKVRDVQADVDLSNSPTLMSASTPGIIMGTAAYMSPEQAKGQAVDRRTDIFAFGCVLYEMLTSQAAFDGDDVAEILGAVLKTDPDWTRLPASLSPIATRLLQRCLKKNPVERVQHIGDVRLELQDLASGAAPLSVGGPARSRGLSWIATAVAVLVAVLLAIPAARHFREVPVSPAAEMRLQIVTPFTSVPLEFALSPDGRQLVFVVSDEGRRKLWLRTLANTDAHPIAGTEDGAFPFWSADSRSIGFFASSKLYRIDIAGGRRQALAEAVAGRGGAWNADDVILFAATANAPLMRMSASGGEPAAVTHLVPTYQISHRFPRFLPDGRHFLFYALGTAQTFGLYMGSLDGGEPKRLAVADTTGSFLPPDSIVFVRQGNLVARRLDMARGELIGDPITVADAVQWDNAYSLGAFSVSDDGRLAYRPGISSQRQLSWFERTGRATPAAAADSDLMVSPELSPDFRRVAIERTVQDNLDIWLMDLVRGGFTRFTFDPGFDRTPVWSPDGSQIVFSSGRTQAYNLYMRPSNGASAEQLLLETSNNKQPQDWSKDGRYLLYFELDPKTARDLWVIDMTEKERKPHVLVNTPFEERNGQFSPDARWIAYEINESGRFEIVVQPFPSLSGKWQVSTSGGTQPRWRFDGKELCFLAPDGRLMVAPVSASGSTFETGTPLALFQTRIAPTGPAFKHQYAGARDGRFLVNQSLEEASAAPITLIVNWHPERGK